jgi:hypothetical protein
VGSLWENYLSSERVKHQNYNQKNVVNCVFWLLCIKLDWLEENGILRVMNSNGTKTESKIPTAFMNCQTSLKLTKRII